MESARAQIRLLLEKYPLAQVPTRSRITDTGYDLYSAIDVLVKAKRWWRAAPSVHVQTGIQLAVEPGWFYSIEGRSSMRLQDIITFTGIIDSTYTGALIVILQNFGNKDYQIHAGDRIAQLVLHRAYDLEMEQVDIFSPEFSTRGVAGFGSSGR